METENATTKMQSFNKKEIIPTFRSRIFSFPLSTLPPFSFFFTCEETFAGIACGQGLDAVRGVGNLVASIFNGDGVGAGGVGHVGHSVGAVPVVLDGGILRFALRVLTAEGSRSSQTVQGRFESLCVCARLTRICTVSSPSPASRASMVNSTGRLAGTPLVSRPGPLARTLLASCPG